MCTYTFSVFSLFTWQLLFPFNQKSSVYCTDVYMLQCYSYPFPIWSPSKEMYITQVSFFQRAGRKEGLLTNLSIIQFWKNNARNWNYKAMYIYSFDRDVEYGSTGCRGFKLGVQNLKDFCLKINISKENYWILTIGVSNGEVS